eukprot:Plantae.Rhodophyta-Hildenbrandia_rubra.ctg2205.p1 GENE.Plantae.Rhodophyta-Hildenbrandia_rubra.ctg2205~~Plantae.Rhodophyta-Hildenbrandia_rubra.ctg2205.p1  ORF type:complete len:1361 (+),score=243.71 Plantae.Rhodophyta-Hildenbrandia_rubra.ctg2205:378-4460(+)
MASVSGKEQYRNEAEISSGPLSLKVTTVRTGTDANTTAKSSETESLKPTGNRVSVIIESKGKPVQGEGETMLLHWGVVEEGGNSQVYMRPDKVLFPKGTDERDGQPSVQTPFKDGKVVFDIAEEDVPPGIVFLALIKAENGFHEQWLKNDGGSSFSLDLAPAIGKQEVQRRVAVKEKEEKDRVEREEKLRKEKEMRAELEKKKMEQRENDKLEYLKYVEGDDRVTVFQKRTDAYKFGELVTLVLRPKFAKPSAETSENGSVDEKPGDIVVVSTISLEGSDLYLHWGVKMQEKRGWNAAPSEVLPKDSKTMDDGKAVQSMLRSHGENGLRVLRISNLPQGCLGMFAVLFAPSAPDHQKWIQAAKGGDIAVALTPAPPLPGLGPKDDISEVAKSAVEQIIEREVEYDSWTLMHRYKFASQLINSVIGEDQDAWAAIYVWLRYSQARVLTWQRHYNTKPRELSHAQLSLVTLLANRYKSMPQDRWLIRLAMSCVGRGGSGDLGQRIRDDILVICRIGNWGHGSMMEDWHQKLHNNTNPDDVVICDALLAFWHSNGDKSRYWNVIYSNGITRERLASYEQPVRAEPDFQGHIKDTMIGELSKYGDLLKAVHLGTDLSSIHGRCQGIMDQGVRDKVNDFMHARYSDSGLVDILRALPHARKALQNQVIFSEHVSDESRRDLIFLDIALESEARRAIESFGSMGHDQNLWANLASVHAAADSLGLSERGMKTEKELERASNDIRAVIDRLGTHGESHDTGLRAAAGLTIIRNVLTEIIDRFNSKLGPLSKCLGIAFGATKEIYSTFIEECVRGGPAFSLSALLRVAEPSVRRVADLSPYSVISPHEEEEKGPLIVYQKLRESTGARVPRGTIIVAASCDGDEDVPEMTAFVIIGTTVDVLSHVSVRARNEKHGLVACLDASELERLMGLHGCIVRVKLTGENFQLDVLDKSGLTSPSAGIPTLARKDSTSDGQPRMHRRRRSRSGFITPPSGLYTPKSEMNGVQIKKSHHRRSSSIGGAELRRVQSAATLKQKNAMMERQAAAPWAIRPSEFSTELVGSKSLNLQRLGDLGLPSWINIPKSVVVPNGAMKKVLRYERNADIKLEYDRLVKEISTAKAGDVRLCPQIRDVIMMLKAPEGLYESLRGILQELGCEDVDDEFDDAWEAVKGVWASLWNERAHLARKKQKLDVKDVYMAVLCQAVVPAEYAFVIHTINPLTGDKNEIYAEAVIGLGETLVGNAPGQALGFTMRKDENMDTGTPIIRSYPSKATALKGGKYIFRSDSNAEDLEGFAGAGLHDSIPIEENTEVDIDYAEEKIMTDDDFRLKLMRGIAKVGKEVEETMGGGAQDIEGCYADGKFYIVQARPQV